MKSVIIQSIADQLNERGIKLSQKTINYLFSKKVDFLKGVSRAIYDDNNQEIIAQFAKLSQNSNAH